MFGDDKIGETELHKTLKLVGWALLIKKGVSPLGFEISLPTYEHNTFEPRNQYHIVDVAGLARHEFIGKGKYGSTARVETIYAIEAKASRSDFRSGFCNRGFGKLWIISTPDTVPPEELPGGIGLYEYDPELNKVKIKSKSMFTGYEPSKHATDNMRNDLLWSGYGWSIHKRYESNEIFKTLFAETNLDSFLENGEGADIHKPVDEFGEETDVELEK